MRLKSGLWVAAYLRRCNIASAFAVVRRRGAEDAGAIFIRISRLDGSSDLFGPAPQSAFEEAGTIDRAFSSCFTAPPVADAEVEAYLAREMKFDPDVWIIEVEDRAGRNFLDDIVA